MWITQKRILTTFPRVQFFHKIKSVNLEIFLACPNAPRAYFFDIYL